jgi:uncharacterized metal-binding protein YceD (DUF177 family)
MENAPLVFKYADIKAEGGRHEEMPVQPALFADAFDAPDTLKKLDLELDFSVGGDSILLEGKVRAELNLNCSRCGDPVTRVFEDSFDEVYPDTLEYIDTREVVRETTALLAPIKVLCSEGCKGRCLVCGANRNKQACSCKPDRASPFEALKDLKVNKPGKPGGKL